MVTTGGGIAVGSLPRCSVQNAENGVSGFPTSSFLVLCEVMLRRNIETHHLSGSRRTVRTPLWPSIFRRSQAQARKFRCLCVRVSPLRTISPRSTWSIPPVHSANAIGRQRHGTDKPNSPVSVAMSKALCRARCSTSCNLGSNKYLLNNNKACWVGRGNGTADHHANKVSRYEDGCSAFTQAPGIKAHHLTLLSWGKRNYPQVVSFLATTSQKGISLSLSVSLFISPFLRGFFGRTLNFSSSMGTN